MNVLKKDKSNDFDVSLGMSIKKTRVMKGFTQESLGRAVGVSFQQIQKYESGANRVSVSKMVQMSRALEISPALLLGDAVSTLDKGLDITLEKEALQLLTAYRGIKSKDRKRALLNIAQALVSE